MALKHHTIILVPHARARLRKWHITNRQLGIFGASFLALTLAACYIAWSYFTTTIDRRQITQLQQENESLREVNDSFKNTVDGLEARLSEYEKRTRDLAILAGLDTSNTGFSSTSPSALRMRYAPTNPRFTARMSSASRMTLVISSRCVLKR